MVYIFVAECINSFKVTPQIGNWNHVFSVTVSRNMHGKLRKKREPEGSPSNSFESFCQIQSGY